jgi:serine/threonine protein kinase/Flp pilus assembly protein TadD
VKTKSKRACSVCGTLVPDDSESCPVCALRGALGNESAITEAQVEPTDSVSQLRFEHYEVLTREDGTPLELGRGAMGVTYKALDVNLRYAVALKVINARFIGDESARRRFVREARAVASVRHPNVASVFHLGKSGDSYFYAMEFVDGESLDKLIRRSGRLEPLIALKVMMLVAAGLEAIHKQNLIHRDIKPSNIMVSFDGDKIVNAKIIDLGLAKGTVADEGSISEISIQGTFAGTPQYASPEQFAGIGADIRSDLYSLGITLWEMLAGEVPFKGSTSRLIYQHQHTTPPVDKLTHVPQPVIALLEVLLEKDQAQRLQTPTELLQAIPRVTEALDSGRRATTDQLRLVADGIAARPKQSTRRLHRVLTGARMGAFGWLLASVLGIAGLLLAWFFFSSHQGLFFNHPVAQAVPTEKSIAVLPFENISANKDDAYFADGVQDEILNNLAKIAQLKVISRTSVMQYRADAKRDLRQIASALGVANVLEGTVRRDGNHVRGSTELIDGRNDNTIWADSYDRDLTDIFAIQSEVAQTIAGKLTATLSPEEKKRIEAKPTDSLEAYDLYLRAKQLTANARVLLAFETSEKQLREGINFLEQAIHLDPKFALAYCASAEAQDLLYLYELTPARRASADAAISDALRLQPDLPEVHLAYAQHLVRAYRDYERARVQLAIAKRSLTNNPDAILLEADIDRRQGNLEKAIQRYNEVLTLDPGNSVAITSLAFAFCEAKQYRAAEREYDRLIVLLPDRPTLKIQKAYIAFVKTGENAAMHSAIAALPTSIAENTGVLSLRLCLAFEDRDWQQARELIEKMKGEDNGDFAYGGCTVPVGCYSILLCRLQGGRSEQNSAFIEVRDRMQQRVQRSPEDVALLSQLSVVDALLDNKQAAISEAKRAVEMLPVSKDAMDGPGIALNLAVVYAWTNEVDMAFETLDRLTKTPNSFRYGLMKADRFWDPLRKDPRFEKLLAELAPKD